MNSIIGSGMSLLLLLCFTTISQILQVDAVYIDIPSSGTKCVSENIHSHTVVLGYYYVVTHIVNASDEATNQGYHPHSISIKVTSPYGNKLHHNEKVIQGEFAFTTDEGGNYEACFSMDREGQEGATISIEWKTGISTKDWDAVAKKEKIDGVELELKKVQETVTHIHTYLLYLKDKEAKMREINEKTNNRVAWLSIMSLSLCIFVSVLQLCYLKRFFQKKKLI